MTEYWANLSYGKDSTCMLEVIRQRGLPLDGILTIDVWFSDTISADLPPVQDFKKYTDKEIVKRYGVAVEHIRSDTTYCDIFYKRRKKGKFSGNIYGFPMLAAPWCNSELKMRAIKKFNKLHPNAMHYIGYAIDEKSEKRQEKIALYLQNGVYKKNKKFPLCDNKITENQAMEWCRDSDFLNPVYAYKNRDGCWFCHNQSLKALSFIKKNYPEYWNMLMQLDYDSPVTFRRDNITLHDIDDKIRESIAFRQMRLFD